MKIEKTTICFPLIALGLSLLLLLCMVDLLGCNQEVKPQPSDTTAHSIDNTQIYPSDINNQAIPYLGPEVKTDSNKKDVMSFCGYSEAQIEESTLYELKNVLGFSTLYFEPDYFEIDKSSQLGTTLIGNYDLLPKSQQPSFSIEYVNLDCIEALACLYREVSNEYTNVEILGDGPYAQDKYTNKLIGREHAADKSVTECYITPYGKGCFITRTKYYEDDLLNYRSKLNLMFCSFDLSFWIILD